MASTADTNFQQTLGHLPLRWPITLWTLQLIAPMMIFAFGAVRLENGHPFSSLVWTVLLGGTIWTVMIFAVLLHRRGRQWLRRVRFKLLLVMVSSVGSFVVFGEGLVRAVSIQDIDGNLFFRGYRLQPYQLPLKRLRSVVEAYLRSDATSHIFDPELGWKPRQLYTSELYVHNSDGIRVDRPDREYAPHPPAKTYRICIFGDSFAYGAEVGYQETWGRILENRLNYSGVRTEVLNFGVSGYGIDQAYLRWTQVRAKYSCQMVVFGLQAENIRRNANLIRPLYGLDMGFPFSKPRFLRDRGKLRLINSPSMSPPAILKMFEHIDDWDLLKYEEFYDPRHYRPRVWHASRLATAIVHLLVEQARLDRSERQLRERMTNLSLDIIDLFRRSVASREAEFIVVHLPREDALTQPRSIRFAQYESFVQRVASQFELVDTSETMRQTARSHGAEALFAEMGHYSLLGNRLVGDVLSRELPRYIRPN